MKVPSCHTPPPPPPPTRIPPHALVGGLCRLCPRRHVCPLWWRWLVVVPCVRCPRQDSLRTFFTQTGSGGSNSLVWAEEWTQWTNTHGKFLGLMFRIRNRASANVTWPLTFEFSSASNYQEATSITLNGVLQFNSEWPGLPWTNFRQCAPSCKHTLALAIPPSRISTVMFMVASGSGPSAVSNRNLYLAFTDNSLRLPEPLDYIDDMYTSQGGFEQ